MNIRVYFPQCLNQDPLVLVIGMLKVSSNQGNQITVLIPKLAYLVFSPTKLSL